MWLWLTGCVFITADDIANKQAQTDSGPTNDADGDGFTAGVDCDDDDDRVFPGATEQPNTVDDDCDGLIDNNTLLFDDDGDGFCEQEPCSQDRLEGVDPELTIVAGDCDDTNASVAPGAVEHCDGIKNDCDRVGDEFYDADGDGWSIADGDPDDKNPAVVAYGVRPGRYQVVCDVARVEPEPATQGCEDSWCDADEGPEHQVTLTRPFLVMREEVSHGFYISFIGDAQHKSSFPECGDTCPAHRVSWTEAMEFANILNEYLELEPCEVDDDPYTCEGFRLPTEAEWEYAARGDDPHRYSGAEDPSRVAWTLANSGLSLHPGGLKEPNGFGIYDMSGNVSEWTFDRYQYYTSAPATDPYVTATTNPPAEERVLRGSSGKYGVDRAHVSARLGMDPDTPGFYDETPENIANPDYPFNWIGFRLVRTAP